MKKEKIFHLLEGYKFFDHGVYLRFASQAKLEDAWHLLTYVAITKSGQRIVATPNITTYKKDSVLKINCTNEMVALEIFYISNDLGRIVKKLITKR